MIAKQNFCSIPDLRALLPGWAGAGQWWGLLASGVVTMWAGDTGGASFVTISSHIIVTTGQSQSGLAVIFNNHPTHLEPTWETDIGNNFN